MKNKRIILGYIIFGALIVLGIWMYCAEKNKEEVVMIKISEGFSSTIQFGRMKNNIVYIDNFNMDKFIVDSYDMGYVGNYFDLDEQEKRNGAVLDGRERVDISNNAYITVGEGIFRPYYMNVPYNANDRKYKVALSDIEGLYNKRGESGIAYAYNGKKKIYHRYPSSIEIVRLDNQNYKKGEEAIYSSSITRDTFKDYKDSKYSIGYFPRKLIFPDENLIRFRDSVCRVQFNVGGYLHEIVKNGIEIHLDGIKEEEKQEVVDLGKDEFYRKYVHVYTGYDGFKLRHDVDTTKVNNHESIEDAVIKNAIDGYNIIYKLTYDRTFTSSD